MTGRDKFKPLLSSSEGDADDLIFEAFKSFYHSMATCPISGNTMTHPVIATDGYCYDKDELEKYMAGEAHLNRTPKGILIENTQKKYKSGQISP
jgi:hypothetical protein